MKKTKAKPRPKARPKAFNYKKDLALRRKLYLKSLAAVNKLKAELGLEGFPVVGYSPAGTDAVVHVNHWSHKRTIVFGIDFGGHIIGPAGGKPSPDTEVKPYFMAGDDEVTKVEFVREIKKWAGKRTPLQVQAEENAAHLEGR